MKFPPCLLLLLCAVIGVCCFKCPKPSSISTFQKQRTRLAASFWGNYKSDGKREGNIGLAIAVLLCIKGNFMSIDVRKTYMCPSGAGSERVLASLIEQEPTYKCLPPNELFVQFLTSPLVFPGDPKYDPHPVVSNKYCDTIPRCYNRPATDLPQNY